LGNFDIPISKKNIKNYYIDYIKNMQIGSFQKIYISHRGNSKLTPLPPSDVLKCTIIRNNFFSPPPPESVDLFWNNPLAKLLNVV
jgi:DNA-binding protein